MGNQALLKIGKAIKKEHKADKRLLLIRAIAHDPWWKQENRRGMESVWNEKDDFYNLPNLAEQPQEMTANPTSTWSSRANDGDMAIELVTHSCLPPDKRDPPIMDMAMRNISGDTTYTGEASAGAETASIVEGPRRANRENILSYEGDEAYDDTMFDYSDVIVSSDAGRAAARINCLKYPPDKVVMARLKRTMKGRDNDKISCVSYKTMDDSVQKSETVIRSDFTKCLIEEGDFVNDAIVCYYRALLNRRDYVTHGEDLPRQSWIFESFVACLVGMKDESKVHDGLTAQVPGKVQHH